MEDMAADPFPAVSRSLFGDYFRLSAGFDRAADVRGVEIRYFIPFVICQDNTPFPIIHNNPIISLILYQNISFFVNNIYTEYMNMGLIFCE